MPLLYIPSTHSHTQEQQEYHISQPTLANQTDSTDTHKTTNNHHRPSTTFNTMKVTTILLAAVATVMAAPFPTNSTTVSNTTAPTHLTKRSSPMCENCFSCKATQQGPVLRYKLRIGAPFDNGSGCANIKKALDDAGDVPDIDKFSCKDDKGMTKSA